ncbi:MAG: DUF362 domain-containing protein, partial [Isosphaeraceae bacterium]
MIHRYPCGTISRRSFLAASGASLPVISSLPLARALAEEPQARIAKGTTHVGAPANLSSKLGAPGLYPGRVVEVKNPAMIRQGVRNAAAIKATLEKGLTTLTGAPHAVDAWRTFFEPGDVVGIKVIPNGSPLAHSSFELVIEVIEGLKAAGVKSKDIFVYDRYRGEFMGAGYHKILPSDIRWGGLTPDGGDQFQVDFPSFRNDPIAGYDPDAFVWMDLMPYGDDPKDDRKYRSHLGKLVTKVVNKIVGLPVLKDHGSAGVTGALKNMSHGSVNNVARSHSNTFTNVCNQFIPQVASHPIIRSKYVLQIMDGIRGIYQGGPFSWWENGKYTWEYNALFVATDPVALDHVEWDIVDAKRIQEKFPPVGSTGKLAGDPLHKEGYDIR